MSKQREKPPGAPRDAARGSVEPTSRTPGGVVTNTAAFVTGDTSGAPPSSSPALRPGTPVGRYRIVELLGTGGGGRVYRAHDPELSRDIALKVLHRTRHFHAADTEYSRRLLREAKTLAKLSHPNVVAAYDVGTIDDSVFVAMELVQGESLHQWLQREPRAIDAILRVSIAVGRGLIAAHDAGVMHRDIKPANVMVAPDGGVRIVDFGLARALRSTPESPRLKQDTDRIAYAASLTNDATDTALLSGTPGYIAPEILLGEPVIDAKADQYSYAVTLFVALTGQKPYAAESVVAYLGAITRDERAPWPRSVPRRIREVVERGLSTRAADRYPSVQELVEALERVSQPRRRPLALATAGACVALLATGAIVVRERAVKRALCQVDTAAFQGVWDAERRQGLERALTSTGRFNASEAFGLLAGRLDRFESDWLAMRQDSCQATHVRGEQSERVLGLRNSCLERKLEGVKALVTAFSDADPRSVDRAAGASPDSIRDCADTAELLGSAEQLPSDPAQRDAIRAVESGFAVTRALIAAGRNAAIENARSVLESAKKIGHAPTVAQAVASVGHAISVSARTAEEHKLGEETLRESVRLAAQVGDSRVLAKTASHLFVVLAYGQRRVQEADAMLPMVEAFVSLAGHDVEQRLELLMGRGVILSQRRRFDEAARVFDQVIELAPSADSELRGYGAYAQGEIGKMDLELKRYPDAVRRFQAQLEGIRRELGNRHPRVVFSLLDLALAQSKAGLRGDAQGNLDRIRELVSSLYPPGDWRYVTIPYVAGSIHEDSGECQLALPLYREAFATMDRTYGSTHSNTADIQAKLGSCLHALDQDAEAVLYLERVLKIRTDVGGAPNVIADAAFQLAGVLAGAGAANRKRAIALGEQAIALWRKDDVSDRAREAEEWVARLREQDASGRP